MRRLYIGLAVLVIVVAVAIVVLMSRREKPLHAGKGMVTSVDVGGGRVTMKDEARGNLVLVLSRNQGYGRRGQSHPGDQTQSGGSYPTGVRSRRQQQVPGPPDSRPSTGGEGTRQPRAVVTPPRGGIASGANSGARDGTPLAVDSIAGFLD